MKYFILIFTLVLFTACRGDKKPKVETTIQQEVNSTIVIDSPIEERLTLEKVELKSALENYFTQLKSLNADNIISMTYPKLFIPINQDKFREYLNTMLISSDVQVTSFDTNINKLGAIQTYSEGKFSQIDYNSTIQIHLLNPKLYNTQRKLLILDKILGNKYGKDNFKVNSFNRTVTIKKQEKLLAIKENGEEWKFLGDNSEYRRLYHKILPNEIVNMIN